MFGFALCSGARILCLGVLGCAWVCLGVLGYARVGLCVLGVFAKRCVFLLHASRESLGVLGSAWV